ncbi:glycerophosphodiester phosphodiesterase family protein [uncultured Desulfosarcina sp.]|uniref:glycerophosphodiester phosphodiesterase n=1 Tax=uncultured Desulfosarcina sp. TaxID=218289 RepID=UPI0029C8A367|nr:glycerophosphodiester phosphodiesterase family protein [uncultured Desulfosarcina sp.]
MNSKRHSTTGTAERLENNFHRLAGAIFRRWPRPAPPGALLQRCQIVSHRGEHDNRNRLENTLAAFDAAAEAGVWGLEMDIRWTADRFPVVFHDPDTRRLYPLKITLASTPLDRLKDRFPLIPTLSEVVERFGGKQHLMIEIKAEPWSGPSDRARRFKRALSHLVPGRDFHLMGLQPELFARFDFLPARAFVPIARFRMDRFSRLAAARGYAGVSGHYLLAGNGVVDRHHRIGQKFGTGFADSRRCLYREAARGVDWIFSNRAADMQAICTGKNKAPM